LFSVITPSERFNDQREMDKGAEHHIDFALCDARVVSWRDHLIAHQSVCFP
jgi:hypothetical protein